MSARELSAPSDWTKLETSPTVICSGNNVVSILAAASYAVVAVLPPGQANPARHLVVSPPRTSLVHCWHSRTHLVRWFGEAQTHPGRYREVWTRLVPHLRLETDEAIPGRVPQLPGVWVVQVG